VILKEHWHQGLVHVPGNVIGQHAQEDMGAHALRQAMVDGPHLEVHGFDGAEGALHLGQAFVG
jgi:hypothetical protein